MNPGSEGFDRLELQINIFAARSVQCVNVSLNHLF